MKWNSSYPTCFQFCQVNLSRKTMARDKGRNCSHNRWEWGHWSRRAPQFCLICILIHQGCIDRYQHRSKSTSANWCRVLQSSPHSVHNNASGVETTPIAMTDWKLGTFDSQNLIDVQIPSWAYLINHKFKSGPCLKSREFVKLLNSKIDWWGENLHTCLAYPDARYLQDFESSCLF